MPYRTILLPLILLSLFITGASAQVRKDLIHIPSTIMSEQRADTVVKAERPYVMVEWELSEGFTPPYCVSQVAGEDTLFRATTSRTSFSVGLRGSEWSKIDVSSAGGKSFGVRMTYTERSAAWIPIGLIGMFVAIAAICAWVYAVRQRKKLDGARREIEEAKTRHTRKYDFATVLFSDIQGFTKIAAHLNPEQLVDELDRYFIYFDELVDKYGVEKIKTIGDAYMCAGGVPDNDSANPIEVTLVGLGMIAYVNERHNEERNFWNIRVGINTGPVVSGHLGNIKKVFDIWGDTVNTASRMESGGEPGRVNVSESTYQKIKDFFECEYRGKMPVKYKGEIDMYFVNRLKEEYCQAGSDHIPNTLMLRKMQLMRIHDFEQSVRETTLDGAHPNLLARFDDYLARVYTLCTLEKMPDEEVTTCGAAAIFSFIKLNIPKDTTVSTKGAEDEIMRKMHLQESTRESVRRVVAHVAGGKEPEDRMEEILTDAGNEVYGRKDIVPQLIALHEELAARGLESKSRNAWLGKQINILKEVTYHTDSARRLCEVPKAKQLEMIEMAMAI